MAINRRSATGYGTSCIHLAKGEPVELKRFKAALQRVKSRPKREATETNQASPDLLKLLRPRSQGNFGRY